MVKSWLLDLGFLDKNAAQLGIRKIYANDIFLCSYPKSGSHWFRFLFANLLNAIAREYRDDELQGILAQLGTNHPATS